MLGSLWNGVRPMLPILLPVLGLLVVLTLPMPGRGPGFQRRDPAEVVGRGAHVEEADVPSQLEAVGNQVRADQWRQPECVLVEIHASAKSASNPRSNGAASVAAWGHAGG